MTEDFLKAFLDLGVMVGFGGESLAQMVSTALPSSDPILAAFCEAPFCTYLSVCVGW